MCQTLRVLEFDTRTDLTRAVAAEIGRARRSNLPDAGAVDFENRVGQLGMVHHVGEPTLNLDPDVLVDGDVMSLVFKRGDVHPCALLP